MKFFKILTIATLLPIFTPQKLSAEFTLLSSIVLGMGGSIFKTETLKKEAIIHLAEGEIIEPTELMKSFLKEAKKEAREKSDLEILELLVEMP